MNETKITANKFRVERRRLPVFSWIFFGLTLISLVLEIVCIVNEPFADFFNIQIACYFRMALTWITAWLPFSLVEVLLFTLPVWMFLMLRLAYRNYASSWRNVGIFCLIMLSILCMFFVCYVFSLGGGYQGSTLDRKLELERRDVSAEELTDTASLMTERLQELEGKIYYGADDFSVMPYGYGEMVKRLLVSYDSLEDSYSFIKNFRSPVKIVMHSEPWTYTHITGVYSYFTGEANLNINMPDYTLPFTAAHELAHQRGIAREDEANFVAYLVCIHSEDPYIQYSGYLNMFEYLANPLHSADKESYNAVYRMLPRNVIGEEYAYSDFFSKYRKTVISTVSEAVNDTYLKINGTAGTKSYGMVVDLCVAYYRDTLAKESP